MNKGKEFRFVQLEDVLEQLIDSMLGTGNVEASRQIGNILDEMGRPCTVSVIITRDEDEVDPTLPLLHSHSGPYFALLPEGYNGTYFKRCAKANTDHLSFPPKESEEDTDDLSGRGDFYE